MSMNTVPERLAALRAAMQANGVDVYLIPVGDPHSSEYLPDHYTSLTYFSGFHGENSNFVVTMTESAVWADGRYFVQAEKEIAGTEIQLMRMGEPGVPTAEEYCGKVLPEGGGTDAQRGAHPHPPRTGSRRPGGLLRPGRVKSKKSLHIRAATFYLMIYSSLCRGFLRRACFWGLRRGFLREGSGWTEASFRRDIASSKAPCRLSEGTPLSEKANRNL